MSQTLPVQLGLHLDVLAFTDMPTLVYCLLDDYTNHWYGLAKSSAAVRGCVWYLIHLFQIDKVWIAKDFCVIMHAALWLDTPSRLCHGPIKTTLRLQ
jgi:hypothetical protein